MSMHIGHLALRVTDVEGYVDHITQALGLKVLDQGAEEAYLGTQDTRHELHLIKDTTAAFDHVGLMVETAEEFDAAVERAEAAGGEVTEGDGERGSERSANIIGPGGITHHLYIPTKREPLTLARSLSAGLRRLGHLTFFSSEADALVAFWRDGLGFRLSDTSPGFTWLRCDPYHHTLAVGRHPTTTILNHHAWEIQDIAALCKYCDVNGLNGRPQIWGPVRHGPGFNLATYMPDAAGSLIEIYTDLLIIDDDKNYAPIDWSDESLSHNLWGTMPPAGAMAVGIPIATSVPA